MTNELTLICDACRKPVDGNDAPGYLWVDEGAVLRADKLPGSELVRWQAHHQACDPELDAWAYHIEQGDLRTYKQLIERTAHLLEKPWLSVTDWTEVLRGVPHGTTRLVATRRA